MVRQTKYLLLLKRYCYIISCFIKLISHGKLNPFKLYLKAAIELGGDFLAEFFVFGTAIAVVLIEYVRSGWKQQSKQSSVDNKVAALEANTQMLLEKVDANNTRIVEMSTVLVTQKSKIEDLNNKINILDNRKNLKFATQASQTTDGRQIGKVIQSKKLGSSSASSQASSDVTNSILYQVAEETAVLLMPFKKAQVPAIQTIPNKVEETAKPSSNGSVEKKQPQPNKTSTKNTDTAKKIKTSSSGSKASEKPA